MKSARTLFSERVGELNPLQREAFSEITAGSNCLIVAPTGSGKTEAAMLPILERLSSAEKKGIQALYITPLRALNRDLMKRLEEMCGTLEITIGVRHGDTSQKERQAQAAKPPQILITTPETLQNLLLSPRLRTSLANLQFVIVDELHELYYNKRGAQLSIVLQRIAQMRQGFTRIGLSATIGNEAEAARFLFGELPYRTIASGLEKRLEIKVVMPMLPLRRHPEFESTFNLDEQALARIEYIEDTIKSSKATLVFANTRQVVEAIGSKLLYLSRLEGFDYVGIHHSSLDSNERIEIENRFKQGQLNCIIATSSLELGIDIGRIETVIQYGSPRQSNRLLQRVGRSGHREGAVSKGHIVVSGPLEALESGATVIAASNRRLESRRAENLASDVLANQLCGMALEYRGIELEKAYAIVKSAAPYAQLERSQFRKVLEFCTTLGLVRVNERKIVPGGRTRTYFIENISVIPDSRRYLVKRASNNKIISTLDEWFVYNSLDENASFITKGVPWKVVSITDDTIFVEPGADLEASIPDWEGEDIPVSLDIAQNAMKLLAQPKPMEEFTERGSFDAVAEFSKKQRGFFIPSPDNIFIEELEDYTVLFMPLGKLANEFIAKSFVYLLRKSGVEVFIRATAYAIIVELRNTRRRPDMRKLIKTLCETDLEAYTKEILSGSELYRHKFVHVAKLFGILEKKATLSKGSLTKLIEFYNGTVLQDETIRDLKKNYVDYDAVSRFISDLKQGKILIKEVSTGSPFSREAIRGAFGYRELLSTDIPDADVEELKHKLARKPVQLLCTYCTLMFSREVNTRDLSSEKILCMRCKSPMISTFRQEYYDAVSKKREGKRLTKQEGEDYRNAINEAGLLEAHGDRAIAALTTYGVGLITAGRLLKHVRKSDKPFIEDVLRAQRLFIRNSKFWKKA